MLKTITLLMLVLTPLQWVYVVDPVKCNGCGNCLYGCQEGAISMVGGNAYIDPELCTGCGICVAFCPRNAIYKEWYTGIETDETDTGVLSLSENPVSSGTVTASGASPLSEVVVLDRSGRQVLRCQSDNLGTVLLDTSKLPGGTYTVISDGAAVLLTVI
jgi:MinD superfamily P-loop ATPase